MKDQKEVIQECIKVLKRGGLILYPTDTVWGIGCDATNADAIDKVYKLKQRSNDKSLICLVSDFKMLNQYVEEIPEVAYDLLKYANKPTTIIYQNPIRVATNLIAEDDTLAIRVVNDIFAKELVRKYKKPIVSTSANLSGQKTPDNFFEISEEVLKGVDYVVNLHQSNKNKKPSTIIKLDLDGKVQVIRK